MKKTNVNQSQNLDHTQASQPSQSSAETATLVSNSTVESDGPSDSISSPSLQDHHLQNGTSIPSLTLNSIVPSQSSSSDPCLGSPNVPAAHPSNPSTPVNGTNGEQSFLDGHRDPHTQTLKT